MSTPFPVLELRPLEQAHAENMLRWMLDPEVAENVGLRSTPTLERTRDWIAKVDGDACAIVHDGCHVGNVVLDQFDNHLQSARVSIYIGEPSARGRGIAAASLRMALARGFERRKLCRIWLTAHEHNARAISLYFGLGFQKEGTLRGDFLLRGKRVDAVLMSMLASEFNQARP